MSTKRKSVTPFGKWMDDEFGINVNEVPRKNQWSFYREWYREHHGCELSIEFKKYEPTNS